MANVVANTVTTIVELDERGESMWREVNVDGAWDDQARHDRFVQHCFSTGRLAAAGARYRAWLDAHPDDAGAALARRMQQRLVFLSTQALVPSSRVRGTSRLIQSPWFVVIVLLGAVAGALVGFASGGFTCGVRP